MRRAWRRTWGFNTDRFSWGTEDSRWRGQNLSRERMRGMDGGWEQPRRRQREQMGTISNEQ